MDGMELLQKRSALFCDAVACKNEIERVPQLDNVYSWKIVSDGYKLSEALYNYDIMAKVVEDYCTAYSPDAIADAGGRNAPRITDVFGDDRYYEIDDERSEISYRDASFVTPDDYPALVDDPKRFLWSTYLPRKWSNLRKSDNGKYFAQGMGELLGFSQGAMGIQQMMVEHGVLLEGNVSNAIPFMSGFEYMFSQMRGIRGLSIDMRRDPEGLLAACEAVESFFGAYADPQPMTGHDSMYAFDFFLPMLAQSILTPAQFEKFMWPSLQRLADYCVKYDKTCILFVESNSERFYDYFNELPKGHFCIQTELNDIFEMKEKLPGKCIAGGMPTRLLWNGTPDECVDYAKRLVDECGAGGGYIFSQDKMMSFPHDARKENMKAVADYLQNGQ